MFGNTVFTLVSIRGSYRYRGIPQTGEIYKASLHNPSLSFRRHYSLAAVGLASLKAAIDQFNTRH